MHLPRKIQGLIAGNRKHGKVGPSCGPFAGLSKNSFSVPAFQVSEDNSLGSWIISYTLPELPRKRGVAVQCDSH